MKLKRTVVSLGLLFALIMVVSVKAIPETVVTVTGTQPPFTTSSLSYSLNNGGIFIYGGVATGTVELHIDSTTYVLELTEQFNTSINTKTNIGQSNRKILWEYIVDDEVVGTFKGQGKGTTNTTLYAPNGFPRGAFSTNLYHVVLQGSGVFYGQTLKLDGLRLTVDPSMPTNTPANPTTWEGILLTHGQNG
jgi:hypothetical protein